MAALRCINSGTLTLSVAQAMGASHYVYRGFDREDYHRKKNGSDQRDPLVIIMVKKLNEQALKYHTKRKDAVSPRQKEVDSLTEQNRCPEKGD